jgi:hypothetical protein
MIRPATILRVGAVTPLGRELSAIADKLEQPPQTGSLLLRVNDQDLSMPAMEKQLRRADRFVRMAAVAALDCCSAAPAERTGLIITSGLGPHHRGFKFIDGILDCGDSAALPTDFSHSVHGVAASYIAGLLDLRGPTMTTTDFEVGFEQAVLLAQCWLDQGTCARVLIGAVDELGDVLVHCARRMLRHGESAILSEGAIFFLLGPHDTDGIAHIDASRIVPTVDVVALESPRLVERSQTRPPPSARNTVTFTPYIGYYATAGAFHAMGALFSQRRNRLMGKLLDFSPNVAPAGFDNVATFRTSSGRAATLLISKQKR